MASTETIHAPKENGPPINCPLLLKNLENSKIKPKSKAKPPQRKKKTHTKQDKMKQWDPVGSLKISIHPQTSSKADKEQGKMRQLSNIINKWKMDKASQKWQLAHDDIVQTAVYTSIWQLKGSRSVLKKPRLCTHYGMENSNSLITHKEIEFKYKE